MKTLLLSLIAVMFLVVPSYAASLPDDDSNIMYFPCKSANDLILLVENSIRSIDEPAELTLLIADKTAKKFIKEKTYNLDDVIAYYIDFKAITFFIIYLEKQKLCFASNLFHTSPAIDAHQWLKARDTIKQLLSDFKSQHKDQSLPNNDKPLKAIPGW